MKKNKKLIIISITVLVLLVLGLTISLLVNRNKTDNIDDVRKPELFDIGDAGTSPKIVDMDNKKNVKIKGNTKYNKSKKLASSHYVWTGEEYIEDIFVDEIELYANVDDDKTYFNAKIHNNLKDFTNMMIYLEFYDKSGELIYAQGYLIDELKKGSIDDIAIAFQDDFSNAYDFKVLYID